MSEPLPPWPERVAITGATGSLGTALLHAMLDGPGPAPARIVALSRDEVKQAALLARWGSHPALRCFLGDVRDTERLIQAFRGVEAVVHAAALKRITSAYSPGEMVKTNILGTMHVIQAASQAGVGRVLVISSDKACAPINLYGKTKAVGEEYSVRANAYTWPVGTRVSVVRYGNVLGSRGSVLETWHGQFWRREPLTLVDPAWTRFWLTLGEAVGLIRWGLAQMLGGEVFVPALGALTMGDLLTAAAQAWNGGAQLAADRQSSRIGGEKAHECLVTSEEAGRTWQAALGLGPLNPTAIVGAILPDEPSWTVELDRWRGAPWGLGTYRSDLPMARLPWRQIVPAIRAWAEKREEGRCG